MSYRVDFLNLLAGVKINSVVWTADIDYWIKGKEQAGKADPEWAIEEGYLKLCRELNIMPYYYYGSGYVNLWLARPEYDDKVQVESIKKGHATITTFKTPLGEITQETKYMAESCSEAQTKFAVENKKDLEVFRYIIEHRELKPEMVEDYNERQDLWEKYDGLPLIAMPRSPLAAFFYEWAGIMHGVYLLTDYSEIVKEVFNLMQDQELPIIDRICRLAPPLVHFADNMSSDNMSGYYHDLMEPGHRARLERFHSAGIKCAVHLDGVVESLLPKLVAVGFDAIEAITPKPGGDMDIGRIRETAQNDSVVLWGGVPGILFAPPYTWKDMEEHIYRVLDCWAGTRFVLGVADQVPPDGDIDFCKKIAKIIGN